MTYIEFFDTIASENVSACLTYAPERVIYLGDDRALMNRHVANYQKVFGGRGQTIEFVVKTAPRSKLDKVVEVLTELVETYDDCVFDITGGDEMYVLALGTVLSRYSHKNIQVHKFNLQNNAIYDCDQDGKTIYRDVPKLSVEENVRIYGGEIVYGPVDGEDTYLWDLNADFLKDLDLIWNLCKEKGRLWNLQIGVFSAMKEVGSQSPDGLTLTAPMIAIENYLAENRGKYVNAKGILAYLRKNGLITKFSDEDESAVTVSFKNEQVKRCLVTAGQALEMKVYITAKNTLDKDGKAAYNDALNGVVIDWDGEFHDEKKENIYDTENEIDVLLMHDALPIFISCKNGRVDSDELYKLETVAERFGGPYAKKVLVAPALNMLKDAEYIRQRAKDMKIRVIEDVRDDQTLAQRLKALWS